MKLIIDNEQTQYHRVIMIQSNDIDDVDEHVDVIIDALKAYGIDEENIQDAFLQKCIEWKLIGENND